MDIRRVSLPAALLLAASLAIGPAVPCRAGEGDGAGDAATTAQEKAFRFQMERARTLATDAIRGGDEGAALEAIDAYEAAARFRPKDPVPLAEAALLALDFNHGDRTARLLYAIHEISPDGSEFHFVKGVLHLTRGQSGLVGEYRDAMVEFEAAMKGDFKTEQAADRHFEAMLGHGFDLVEYGRYDQALEVLNRAVALKPGHSMVPRAFYHIAKAYRRLQAPVLAEKALKECIRLFPSYSVAFGELGDLYTELSRFDEAVAVLDDAVRKDPNYAQGHLLRAVAFTGKGMWKEADAAFLEFEKRFLPTGNSELQRAMFHQAAGQPEKGVERARMALALDITQKRAHLVLSQCFHALGMKEESAKQKALWQEAEEEARRASHDRRAMARDRFGPDRGPGGDSGEEPGEDPGEEKPGEEPPGEPGGKPAGGPPDDGGHGGGGG